MTSWVSYGIRQEKTMKLQEAILKLANLIPNGELLAETDPVNFLGMVSGEIINLRKENQHLRGEIDELQNELHEIQIFLP